MCGIIGVVGQNEAASAIVDGLKRLEYRGYDSSGIATSLSGELHCRKAEGKLVNLESCLKDSPIQGSTGIGHTRWATHGKPSVANAHPHKTDKVAVVHNGIIENHQTLRAVLEAEGAEFLSETDSEVLPHLITSMLKRGLTPEEAVEKAISKLDGAYAMGIIFADYPELMIAARSGSPLAVGYAKGESEAIFIGSDAFALSPFCDRISYLEEGDMTVINGKELHIFNHSGQPVERPIRQIDNASNSADKGDYAHYMLKEIFEQPQVISDTIQSFYDSATGEFNFGDLPFNFEDVSRITLVACGTSYYAAQAATYWLEQIARVPTAIDVASEFRYRQPIMPENGLALFISQSGETADTLAALRYCQQVGQHTLALVNVAESSMAMEADGFIQTLAGTEIGVASTKAFTTQLAALACLTLMIASAKGTISQVEVWEHMHSLGQLTDLCEQALSLEPKIKNVAKDIYEARDMLYIGRGTSYPISSEGALKMKELSYIHAESYAAGELKHGPIALIDDSVPIIVTAPKDELFEKTASNLQETAARGGRITLISNKLGVESLKKLLDNSITMPNCDPFIAPILYAIPHQLLAYHTALLKGTDIDQPRNLAKSVTVE